MHSKIIPQTTLINQDLHFTNGDETIDDNGNK